MLSDAQAVGLACNCCDRQSRMLAGGCLARFAKGIDGMDYRHSAGDLVRYWIGDARSKLGLGIIINEPLLDYSYCYTVRWTNGALATMLWDELEPVEKNRQYQWWNVRTSLSMFTDTASRLFMEDALSDNRAARVDAIRRVLDLLSDEAKKEIAFFSR